MTILGIDFYSAMIIKNEIGEIERFLDYEKLCSFAGLVPRVHQSAKVKKRGKMQSKALQKVFSKRKRGEIEAILDKPYPAHFQRVYLVGFLKYAVGLSNKEICELIKEGAKWRDYDPAITEYQVRSIRKASKGELEFRRKQFQEDEANATSFSSLKREGKWKDSAIRGVWLVILDWRQKWSNQGIIRDTQAL